MLYSFYQARNEMFGKIEIDNNHLPETRDPKKTISVSSKKYDYIDLTEEIHPNSNDDLL